MSFIPAAGAEPSEILSAQTDRLSEASPSYEALGEGSFSCGLGEGWRLDQRLLFGEVLLRQTTICCILAGVAVVATVTASDAEFDDCAPELMALLESLRPLRTSS